MAYYYGWTDCYIESLDVDTFLAYYKSADVIEANQQLNSISASISSVQKNTDLKKKISALNKKVKDSFVKDISSVNAKYLAQQMLEDK